MDTDDLKSIIVGILFIILFILAAISITIFNLFNPQNGEHTGYITAVENSGLIFKTNKIYFKTDAQSSQEDVYCIPDEELFNKAKQLSKEKKQVTVIYNNGFLVKRSECSGNDAIAIIREIK